MYIDIESANWQTKTESASAENYLDLACQHLPAMNRVVHNYGTKSIAQYLNKIKLPCRSSFQKREDLAKVVHDYAAPLLGSSVAQKTAKQLIENPLAMTANHHGIDFFSQSVQGSILFSLHGYENFGGGNFETVAPIFSCGCIPLNNLTFPRGLLLYHTSTYKEKKSPLKVPIFPDRLKRVMVSNAKPFDEKMILNAEKRADESLQKKEISPTLFHSLKEILKEDYKDPIVTHLSSYSLQSVVLNSRIWRRLFPEHAIIPEIVNLELEKIVSMLLIEDLKNQESLAWCTLFDPELRNNMFIELDGQKICWDQKILRLRNSQGNKDSFKKVVYTSCGTHFFWGVDTTGRRIPLFLESSGSGKETLLGVDDHGNHFELSFTPDSIAQALKEKRLLPSLFTCFTVIAFARGIACAGGYYQAEYLPNIQRGIVSALEDTKGYQDIADIVKKVDTGIYLSGMQAVMKRTEADMLIPAGPVEIIAAGGLSGDDLERIRSLTVKDAHLASLFETIPDVAPWLTKTEGWKNQLATDCWRLLRKAVVVK